MTSSRIFFTELFLLSLLLTFPLRQTHAQVAISIGIQEIFDDNIFLEDDQGAFTDEARAAIDRLSPSEQLFFSVPDSQNGDPDSDIISNLTLGLATSIRLADIATLKIDTVGGAVLFNDFSDENRWTLNSQMELRPQQGTVPEFLKLAASSVFTTDSYNIGVAEGTLARQNMRHNLNLQAGTLHQLSSERTIDAGYQFQKSDFIGETTFSGDEDDLAEQFQLDNRGADYIRHSFSAGLNNQFSEKTSARLGVDFQIYDFERDSGDTNTTEYDRNDIGIGISLQHAFSERLSGVFGVGFDRSDYSEDRIGTLVPVISTDGIEFTSSGTEDDTPTSLNFRLGVNYLPSKQSSAGFLISQDTGLNASGERLVVRTFDLNFAYYPKDKLTLALGGQFYQYGNDDALSNAYDRLSTTLSAHYSISPSLTLSGGWSFATQDSGNEVNQGLLYTSEDYVANKLYFSLNKGFVGLSL